ncbi:hypothetical protein Dimus_013489, partial [Dionaea muscipula]
VVKDEVDSRSPGPRHPVIFRTTFHRRPAPSPRPWPCRKRSPSPLMRSSVNLDELSSSEAGEGESTELTVMSSEAEGDGQWGEEAGVLGSSIKPDLSLIEEDDGN